MKIVEVNFSALRAHRHLINLNLKEVEYQSYAERMDQRIAAYGDCIHLLPEPKYTMATTRIEVQLLEATARAFSIDPHELDAMIWFQYNHQETRMMMSVWNAERRRRDGAAH